MQDRERDFAPLAFRISDHVSSIPRPAIWNYADRRAFQEIVTGIFLGPSSVLHDTALLDARNIRTLVGVRTPLTKRIFQARYPGRYRFEFIDVVEGSLLNALPRVKPLVDSCLQEGGGLLMYDETGNHKSAVMLCAYLMDSQSVSAQQAYAFVRSMRLSVSPGHHELYQLQEYETLRAARNDIVAHSYTQCELNRTSQRRKHDSEDNPDEEVYAKHLAT